MTETATNTQKTKAKKVGTLSIAAALAFGLLAAPLLSNSASASLDSGAFCIQASSTDGEHKGKKGGCEAPAPEAPAPVVPAPVETTPAPVVAPPAPAPVETMLVSQASSVTVNFQASRWKGQPWTLVSTYGANPPVTYSGTTSANGYMSKAATYDRILPKGSSFAAEPLRLDLTIGADRFSWSVPIKAQRAFLGGTDSATGRPMSAFLGGQAIFDETGTWKLPAGWTAIDPNS